MWILSRVLFDVPAVTNTLCSCFPIYVQEERLDVLEKKLLALDLNPEDYWWYMDLRRYGSVPHAGYGLGFERLVTYICGIENIREAIAFPRYPGNAEF
jgi:asparaginyl-tRNA synthetase